MGKKGVAHYIFLLILHTNLYPLVMWKPEEIAEYSENNP